MTQDSSHSAPSIHSLTAFFEHLGLQWRLQDCGVRLQGVPRNLWLQVEAGEQPYPHPYLGQAHLAFVLWAEDRVQSPNIWWFKLPLDEQGKLSLPERDGLLRQLVDALARNLAAAEAGRPPKGLLEHNPYVWAPNDSQQAMLHARLTAQLKLPASQHYAEALHYLAQGPWAHWQALGLQGLADVVARSAEAAPLKALKAAVPGVPAPVLIALCQLLEHQPLGAGLSQALLNRLAAACDSESTAEINACLRALAASEAEGLVAQALALALAKPLDAEALVTLATRHGARLSASASALAFLEQVAALGQIAFNRILAELLFQPGQRAAWLAHFRTADRSDRLSGAIGGLLSTSH